MSSVDNDDHQSSSLSFDIAAAVAPEIAQDPTPHDPYRALRFRDFRLLLISSFISSIGERMLEVALGWDLYERTHSALVLGGVGLVLIIPVFLFVLPAGHFADRYPRKRIVLIAQGVMVLAAFGLTVTSLLHGSIALIYGCLLLTGCASAFSGPARSALTAQTVPEEAFENAATWNSIAGQLASVIGPGLGGLLIALFSSVLLIYFLNALATVVFVGLIAGMRLLYQTERPVEEKTGEESSWRSVFNGIGFFRRTPLLLAAITLDLFAVLLGGATTLLPIFATDVLHAGPTGLGWLRTAPSIGAICVTLILAHRPPFQKAGRTLLLAVAGFGVATIIFGLSRNFWLSMLMLAALGGLDNISMVIRDTLMLMRTPDEMRGRVLAVESLFVGSSNELGGFESGLTAQLLGPVVSVVVGGIGTVLVVISVAFLWPEMRRLGRIKATESPPDE